MNFSWQFNDPDGEQAKANRLVLERQRDAYDTITKEQREKLDQLLHKYHKRLKDLE